MNVIITGLPYMAIQSKNALRPVQTLGTLLANKTQHCWAQHVASVCTPCCVLLRLVGHCWMKFDTSNKSQQHATTHNMVCKRSQHVGPNNVASCWPTMLRAFARAFWFLRFYFVLFFSNAGKRKSCAIGSFLSLP